MHQELFLAHDTWRESRKLSVTLLPALFVQVFCHHAMEIIRRREGCNVTTDAADHSAC
jgi:hypothetical protein